jgi:hypothetical protein
MMMTERRSAKARDIPRADILLFPFHERTCRATELGLGSDGEFSKRICRLSQTGEKMNEAERRVPKAKHGRPNAERGRRQVEGGTRQAAGGT